VIKLLIADDHAIFREGLKHILEEHPDILVADEAGNGQEVLDYIWKNEYDMILLDIGMPGMSALEVLKQVKNERPRLPVLVLSNLLAKTSSRPLNRERKREIFSFSEELFVTVCSYVVGVMVD